jgi:murein DD-endopeptidase MepM/ murein hydrolase activator NlpD
LRQLLAWALVPLAPSAMLLGWTSHRRHYAAHVWAERQIEMMSEPLPESPATIDEIDQLLLRPFYAVVARPAAIYTLFEGGAQSLVTLTVGSAEGTIHPEDGSRNPAYYGHTDPGNQVWNLGAFSYQHGAKSPEEADMVQLDRLRGQTQQILDKASELGIDLNLTELLNAIDLANQAPEASIGRKGFPYRLKEAWQNGLSGDAAISAARVRAFIDPDTDHFDAPGLGGPTEIKADQERRMRQIDTALRVHGEVFARWFDDIAGDPTAAIAALKSQGVMAELKAGSYTTEDGEIRVTEEAFRKAVWQHGLCDWSSKLGDNCVFHPPDGVSIEAMYNDFAWEIAYAQGKADATKDEDYVCPSSTGVHTSPFGHRNYPRKGFHYGTDIAGPIGTPILAAASGTVTFAGFNGSAGNMIVIHHDDGSKTVYMHNSRLLVSTGNRVNQRQQIAEMGSTGFSTGPHLHFELSLPGSDNRVNPLQYVDCSHLK